MKIKFRAIKKQGVDNDADVYSEGGLEQISENDGIGTEEEGFMRGCLSPQL